MKFFIFMSVALVSFSSVAVGADSETKKPENCPYAGPQTPRDIANRAGKHPDYFSHAPEPARMNLCNIHFHKNAEHKAPGFSVFAGPGKSGGYQCNDTPKLSTAELKAPEGAICKGLKPGDTIEVHWVHTTCRIKPGKGLGSCLSDHCANPQLRVEAQAFLLVNDENAAKFSDYAYAQTVRNGLHQAKALPTGTPVEFRGSTTGPSFDGDACSPLHVTWSVRPSCQKLDINSLGEWCKGNVFKEDHAHGVRALVTKLELLAEID